jgi:hypothetical protein
MTQRFLIALLIAAGVASPWASSGQTPTPTPSPASVAVLDMVAGIEKTLTAVAAEMPEDKYEFAPTEGAFRGVRNFARQIKHAAAVHHLVAATILGERVTAEMADERGPTACEQRQTCSCTCRSPSSR